MHEGDWILMDVGLDSRQGYSTTAVADAGSLVLLNGIDVQSYPAVLDARPCPLFDVLQQASLGL